MSDVTRRDALKMAAAVPLAAPVVRTAFADSDQLQFGLIGAGERGQTLLSRLNAVDSGQCAIICDKYEPHREKGIGMSRGKPAGCADYRELLDRNDVSAVIVATPLYTHFEIVRDALLAGKHVFCEPTLVFKPEEIHALRKLANSKTDQVLQVGFERRYSEFYETARQMVSRGFLGEVTHIQVQTNRNPGWKTQPEDDRGEEVNWRLLRKYSGGLTSELASHQLDLASWMFNDTPDTIIGMGGLDWRMDGRDVYDNIALIVSYPYGQKLTLTCATTNQHLSMFDGTRRECGEAIMGTEGTIELTVGAAGRGAFGLWYYEPGPVDPSKAAEQAEFAASAGASMGSAREGYRPMPIMLEEDQFTGEESFFERELKYSRRWLYAKGIMVPEQSRNAVEAQLDGFFQSCKEGGPVDADLDVGLDNAATVILSNLAMDEHREVNFNEIKSMGLEAEPGESAA